MIFLEIFSYRKNADFLVNIIFSVSQKISRKSRATPFFDIIKRRMKLLNPDIVQKNDVRPNFFS